MKWFFEKTFVLFFSNKSLTHIWGHEFYWLGRFGSQGKFLQFCLKVYYFWGWVFPQIREQMSGGTFLWYEKARVGCWLWLGLGCVKKGLGQLWATFEGGYFNFLWSKKKKKFWKHCSVRTEKLNRKKVKNK